LKIICTEKDNQEES